MDDLDRVDLIALLDRIDHCHGLRASETGVDAIEVRCGDVRDEELATAGVLARVGHGECAGRMLLRVDLALDLVAGAARAGAGGTTTLDHEVLDHAVKIESVIEAFLGERDEVFDGSGRVLVEEFKVDGALA